MNPRYLWILTLTFVLIGSTGVMAKSQPPVAPFGQLLPANSGTHGMLDLVPSTGNRDYGIAGAADRIVDLMCDAPCDGMSWGWPLACPPVYGNIVGPAALGLLWGYVTTDDFNHLVGTFEAADYAICYSYGTGEPRFGSHTPYMLWQLTEVMSAATVYRQYAIDEFYGALEAGNYGPSLYDTTGYLGAIEASRGHPPATWANIKTYDMASLPWGAYLMGTQAQFEEFCNFTYMSIEDLDNTPGQSAQILGFACGIYSLAFAHVDFDPQAGPWAGLNSVMEMAQELTNYQDASGGFYSSVDVPTDVHWDIDTDHWYSGTADGWGTYMYKEFTVAGDLSINFDMMYLTEATYDFGFVEYSTDMGDTWTPLAQYDGALETWTAESLAFPADGTYWLRFRMYQDGGYTEPANIIEPGFYVDNIQVGGGTIDTCDVNNGWTVVVDLMAATDVQDTCYCLAALKAVDPNYFATEIAAAEDYLWDRQLPEGGFETYPGGGVGSEYAQVDGEVIWALFWEPTCWNDGDANDSDDLTPEDAQLAFQHYLGETVLEFLRECAADCNGDGMVTPADALCIWKHYLGSGCDCMDPVIASPAPTKAVAPARQLQKAVDGQLIADMNYNDHTLTVAIDVQAAVNDLDAFGLKVTFPENLTFVSSDFGQEVSEWMYQGAQLHGDTLIVGGFNIDSAIPAGMETNLVTLTFQVDKPVKDYGIQFHDFVDDIANYTISLNARDMLLAN